MYPVNWSNDFNGTSTYLRLFYVKKLGNRVYLFIFTFFINRLIGLVGRVFVNGPGDQVASSSCRAASTDIPDPLSPLLPIVHRLWQVFRAGRPAFVWPYVGVHWSTSLMSSSLLLQQCPACLVRLTWIVFVMGGRWLYSWCLVGCCRQDLLWYLIPPCLTLSNIRYVSRVKWSNPGEGVAPSPYSSM